MEKRTNTPSPSRKRSHPIKGSVGMSHPHNPAQGGTRALLQRHRRESMMDYRFISGEGSGALRQPRVMPNPTTSSLASGNIYTLSCPLIIPDATEPSFPSCINQQIPTQPSARSRVSRIPQLTLLQERIEDLWDELKIPLADRASFRSRHFNQANHSHDNDNNEPSPNNRRRQSTVCKRDNAAAANASQAMMLELVALLHHRQNTIAVMKGIRDRERCLAYLTGMMEAFHQKQEDRMAFLAPAQEGQEKEGEIHRENLVNCLALSRDFTLILVEAIQAWRHQLWRKQPFYRTPEGTAKPVPVNYIQKMVSDVAEQLQTELGRSLLARLCLGLDELGLLVPMVSAGETKEWQGMEMIDNKYRTMFLAHSFEGAKGEGFSSHELSQRQHSAIQMLVNEHKVGKEVREEMEQLKSQGCFIPLLRPLPLEQQQCDDRVCPSSSPVAVSITNGTPNSQSSRGLSLRPPSISIQKEEGIAGSLPQIDSSLGHHNNFEADAPINSQQQQQPQSEIVPLSQHNHFNIVGDGASTGEPSQQEESRANLSSFSAAAEPGEKSSKGELQKPSSVLTPATRNFNSGRKEKVSSSISFEGAAVLVHKVKRPIGAKRKEEHRANSPTRSSTTKQHLLPEPKETKATQLRKSQTFKSNVIPSYARSRSASLAAELMKKAMNEGQGPKATKAAELRRHSTSKKVSGAAEMPLSACAATEYMEKALHEGQAPKVNKAAELRRESLEKRRSTAAEETVLTATESAAVMGKALYEGDEPKQNRAYELRKGLASARRQSDTSSVASSTGGTRGGGSAAATVGSNKSSSQVLPATFKVNDSPAAGEPAKEKSSGTGSDSPVSPLSTAVASQVGSDYGAESFEDDLTAISSKPLQSHGCGENDGRRNTPADQENAAASYQNDDFEEEEEDEHSDHGHHVTKHQASSKPAAVVHSQAGMKRAMSEKVKYHQSFSRKPSVAKANSAGRKSFKMTPSVQELVYGQSIFDIPMSPTRDYGSAVFEMSPNSSMVDMTTPAAGGLKGSVSPTASEKSSYSQHSSASARLKAHQADRSAGKHKDVANEEEEEEDVVTVSELHQLGVKSPVNRARRRSSGNSSSSDGSSKGEHLSRMETPQESNSGGKLSTIMSVSSLEEASSRGNRDSNTTLPTRQNTRDELVEPDVIAAEESSRASSMSRRITPTTIHPPPPSPSSHDAYMASIDQKLAEFRRPSIRNSITSKAVDKKDELSVTSSGHHSTS